MLQKILLILFPLFSCMPIDENMIDWHEDRQLTWADFKGTPDPHSTNAALTNSTINLEYGYNNKGLIYNIKCRFNKSLSWGRVRNDYILKHEQGHFDIAEIHARKLHRALAAYTFNSKTVNDDVTRIHNDVINEHVALQKQYDLQTNHSLDSAQQSVWNKNIAVLLIELSEFRDYR